MLFRSATLAAFRDHGKATATLETGMSDAEVHFNALAKAGIDMRQVGETLQAEGVVLFEQAFDQLLKLLA